MRGYVLVLLAAMSFAGCSGSLDPMKFVPPTSVVSASDDRAALVHPAMYVPPVQRPDTIDITSVLRSVTSLPERIEAVQALERALIACGIVIVLVSVANAVLLVRILTSQRTAPLMSAVPEPKTAALHCKCGNSISARSKTGRCRACAREHLARQRASSMPEMAAAAAVDHAEWNHARFPVGGSRSRRAERRSTSSR